MSRFLGAVFVIFSTSYAGILYGQTFQTRIRQLSGLRKIVTELYSDVEYGACTLSESFERIAKKQEPLYQNFFNKLCEEMKIGYGMPFGILFERAVERHLAKSNLTNADKKQLIELGKQMGTSQRTGQMHILKLYLQELDHLIDELEETKKEKQKLSRVLGISCGVLIVILLL